MSSRLQAPAWAGTVGGPSLSHAAMLSSSLIAFAHFVCAFGVVATLSFEWLTFHARPTVQEARRLVLVDRWYGVFAAGVLVAGLLRVFYFEKGWAFYSATPFFHLKFTLFVLIGLLSIYPTVCFLRWGPMLRAGHAPQISERQHRRIARLLSVQMVLLLVLLLSASLMAKGLHV